MNKEGDLFTLPNGGVLKYKFGEDVNNQTQWYKTLPTKRFIDSLKSKNKERHPILGLWSSRTNQYLIAADFDSLPEGFANFDSLSEFFKNNYSKSSIVSRSFSGKVKVFFLVELPTPYRMNTKIALNTLEVLLDGDENLINAIDKSYPGLSLTYLTSEIVNDLQKVIYIAPKGAILDSVYEAEEEIYIQGGYSLVNNQISYKSLNEYSGGLPEGLDIKCGIEEKLIRILLATPQLLRKEGFNLSIPLLAKQCDTYDMKICRIRHKLLETDYLICIDESYKQKKKAKTYIAGGILRGILEAMYPVVPTRFNKPKNPPIEQIADGEWHTKLWELVWYFPNSEDFVNHVTKIPNFDAKEDRIKLIRNDIDSMVKYNRWKPLSTGNPNYKKIYKQ